MNVACVSKIGVSCLVTLLAVAASWPGAVAKDTGKTLVGAYGTCRTTVNVHCTAEAGSSCPSTAVVPQCIGVSTVFCATAGVGCKVPGCANTMIEVCPPGGG
jgi:hypothetical protein